ncbi:hypothetical protein HPB47_024386 [Ixodes persulcatus]|uniref:Uncharacterized protein n=1 Tax=Ixodes persulcatus TaxID=34615 RepID=A0AC60Q4J2_IXOPE|nr:hypothetical protein HPB47_024386 [Ixodes persulcatus]
MDEAETKEAALPRTIAPSPTELQTPGVEASTVPSVAQNQALTTPTAQEKVLSGEPTSEGKAAAQEAPATSDTTKASEGEDAGEMDFEAKAAKRPFNETTVTTDATSPRSESGLLEVSSLPEVGQGDHPFHGASSWLKRIEYRNGSSVPGTWRLLQPLTKLQALVFRNMPQLQLTEDFNSLPLNLKKIDIANSTIRTVRPAWLSQLTNLEELVVKDTNLNTFERSMLPSPATKLTSLDLRHNELTSLPEDLTRDAPSLRTLNVASNKIRSFSEETFEPLRENQNATVNLEGNPLNCDCHARFLSSVPNSWTSPPCQSPERLRGRQVKQIGISQLLCD